MGASIIPNTTQRRIPANQHQVIQDRHREIARRLILGEKHAQIAQALGMSQIAVHNIANSPLIRDHINNLHDERDEMAKDIGQRLRKLAEEAVTQLEQILPDESTSKSLKVRIAQDVLDRTGFGTKEPAMTNEITAGLMAEIKRRAFDAGILDVTPEQDTNCQSPGAPLTDHDSAPINILYDASYPLPVNLTLPESEHDNT